jgi:hypothetical protein
MARHWTSTACPARDTMSSMHFAAMKRRLRKARYWIILLCSCLSDTFPVSAVARAHALRQDESCVTLAPWLRRIAADGRETRIVPPVRAVDPQTICSLRLDKTDVKFNRYERLNFDDPIGTTSLKYVVCRSLYLPSFVTVCPPVLSPLGTKSYVGYALYNNPVPNMNRQIGFFWIRRLVLVACPSGP